MSGCYWHEGYESGVQEMRELVNDLVREEVKSSVDLAMRRLLAELRGGLAGEPADGA